MNGMLIHRCAIERRDETESVSDSGEVLSHWNTIADGEACYVWARGGSYRQSEFGKVNAANYGAVFGWMTDVRLGDRIVINDRRYEVTFIADRRGHHLEADLALVAAP